MTQITFGTGNSTAGRHGALPHLRPGDFFWEKRNELEVLATIAAVFPLFGLFHILYGQNPPFDRQ